MFPSITDKNMAYSLRHHKIFETSICEDDKVINRNQLPTKLQVLRCRLAYTSQLVSYYNANNEVLKQVKDIYQRAAIPTKSDIGMIKQIDIFCKHYDNLNKVPIEKINMDWFIERKKEFLKSGNTLMDFSGDTKKCLDADIIFLEDMRTTRTMLIGGNDTVTQRKAKEILKKETRALDREKRDQERLQRELKRVEENISQNAASTSYFFSETFTSDNNEQYDTQDLYQPRQSHRDCIINIPRDILNNVTLNALMVRMNITPTQASAFLHTLITECGGNPSSVYLSYNYAYKHRAEAIQNVASQVREEFKGKFPLGVHFDGKLMLDHETNKKIERLPVVVLSSEGETKLLGVSKLEVGTGPGTSGPLIAEATVNELKKWNVQDLIVSMNFDTTNTNTGRLNGACINIQNLIGRPLFWCACRKHMGEVFIGHAWDVLNIEASSGPEISIFNRFKDMFHKISIETARKKYLI